MVKLVALSPAEGLLPVTVGTCTLSEVMPEAITSVTPFRGRETAVSDALKAEIGAGFPAPNRTTGKAGARAIWVGAGQALVLGPKVAPDGAAVTEQSDAWAVFKLEGEDAEAVLARLTPIDVRRSVFKRGHTARTLLQHMTGSITRTGDKSLEIMVFRSMARTAVHELSEAMASVAARR